VLAGAVLFIGVPLILILGYREEKEIELKKLEREKIGFREDPIE